MLIELRGRGRLVPWLGPAFRGISALRYRAAECRQPQDTWRTTWQYCRGCPFISDCGYGQAFEPDVATPLGRRDAPRPLVIAPDFPSPVRAQVADSFHLTITAIGAAAIAALPGVLRAVIDAGRFDGLGPDRVRFNVIPVDDPPLRTVIAASNIPKHAAATPVVRDATIQLNGPLFLRERGGAGSRRQIVAPTLAHLFRASMRVAREFLGEAADCEGRGHLDLDNLCGGLEPAATGLSTFSQEKASHRSRERFGMEGVTGWWRFATLPACLVPWLQLGGMLHVGGHRIAGAGGWEVIFDTAAPSGLER